MDTFHRIEKVLSIVLYRTLNYIFLSIKMPKLLLRDYKCHSLSKKKKKKKKKKLKHYNTRILVNKYDMFYEERIIVNTRFVIKTNEK